MFLATMALQAQSIKIDTLEKAIKKAFSEREFEQAIDLTYQIRPYYKQTANWKKYAQTFTDIAWSRFNNENIEIKSYLDSIALIGRHHCISETSDFYNMLWYLSGRYYLEKGAYDEALTVFDKALVIDTLRFNINKNPEVIGDDYQTLGVCFAKKGDYKRSIEYYNYALPYLDGRLIASATVHHNIASSYEKMNNIPKAREEYQKGITLLENNSVAKPLKPLKKKRLIQFKTNFCACIDSLNCLKNLLTQTDTSDLAQFSSNYQDQANIYRQQGAYNNAEYFTNRALSLRQQKYGNKHPLVSDCHKYLGNIADSTKKHDEALLHYQKALSALVWNFNDSTDITKNPTLEQQISSKVELLEILGNKANDLRQINNLPLALETYELLFDLIDDMRINYLGDLSIYHLLKEAAPLYEAGIETALELEEKEKAFEFIMRSKSVLLLEGVRDLQAKHTANIPETLLQQERDLKIDMAYYERNQFDAQRKGKQAKAKKFERLRFERMQAHEGLLSTLETKYPEYYRLKYNTQVTDIATLRAEALDRQSALIEFFQGEENIYAAILSKQNFDIVNVRANTPQFQDKITTLRGLLGRHSTNIDTFKNISKTAADLHQRLIAPLKIPSNIQKLIIVPDKRLGYIPFQALITALPETDNQTESRYDKLPYLIQKYQIAYAYSSTLLVEKIDMSSKNATSIFGGFAPIFEGEPSIERNGDTLTHLPYSIEEIKEISSIVDGVMYERNTASTENFIAHVSDYRILHLATHANLNSDTPMESAIHFSDNSITTREIYNLPLRTELAVLSACETGTGELQKGEGIMSLARAFAQAGCPSMVASLWKVNDKSTFDLMVDFYENLQAGQSKDAALHHAQIAYLDNIRTYTDAHPYYWAAFVMVGDASPVFKPTNWRWSILAAVGLFLVLLLIWFRRRQTE